MSRFGQAVWKRVREASRNPGAFMFKLALESGWQPFLRISVSRPRTFNQKVRYRMVHDRRSVLGTLADKLQSKRFIEERLGSGFTAPVLTHALRASDLDLASLPREYAVKVSHASGGVILVYDAADRTSRLPDPGLPFSRHSLHPDSVRIEDAVPVLDSWLQRPYNTRNGEWAYSLCVPTVFVEEFLRSPEGGPPADLKLFVFDGKCAMMRLDVPTGSRKTLNHFLPDGAPLPAHFGEYHGALFSEQVPPPELPVAWSYAVELAEELGTGLDFVRVDTYVLGSRVLIGEMTNYPTNGTGRFVPHATDAWLGAHWHLNTHDDCPDQGSTGRPTELALDQ